MGALARAVAGQLPAGWKVCGTTLAAPEALETALATLDRPLIFPFFMAEGYFTRTLLPLRLQAAGSGGLRRLAAFGHTPGLPELTARAALQGAATAGLEPGGTTLLLAAHGSKISRASATGAQAMAARLAALAPFARVLTGFVEEHPLIQTIAADLHPAICLPFFALRAGHVTDDVPRALAIAGFRGILLPAIGEHPGAAHLIAAALQQAASDAK